MVEARRADMTSDTHHVSLMEEDLRPYDWRKALGATIFIFRSEKGYPNNLLPPSCSGADTLDETCRSSSGPLGASSQEIPESTHQY